MSKVIFIPVRKINNLDENLLEEFSKKLPERIFIAYSVQFCDLVPYVKKILEKNHRITGISQILGCTIPRISKNTNAVLVIGSGKFHAVSIAYKINLPVFVLENNSIQEISEKDLADFMKNKKTAKAKFLSAEKIGIVISTKPGQQKFFQSINMKNLGKLKNKQIYLFLADKIDASEFENFPEIQSWVNSACPRLDMSDNRIINIVDV